MCGKALYGWNWIIRGILSLLYQQLQASRENFIKKADETEQKLRECESEKNRIEKEMKQLNNKTSKTLKDLRLDVNVMLRNILNEVRNYFFFS